MKDGILDLHRLKAKQRVFGPKIAVFACKFCLSTDISETSLGIREEGQRLKKPRYRGVRVIEKRVIERDNCSDIDGKLL